MAPSFLYEQTDIPAGMTAAAYRQRRACGLSPLAQRAARLALAARAAAPRTSSPTPTPPDVADLVERSQGLRARLLRRPGRRLRSRIAFSERLVAIR
jgi:hypothetical protein